MKMNIIDPGGKWLYRAGGLSALAIGIGYLAIIPLFVLAGARPSGAEAWLAYLAGNTTVWWAIVALSVLTDFLFVPAAFALYQALKSINRNAMLLAIAFIGLFVILDLALTWTNYAALIDLSGDYASAVKDARRAAYITAAIYPSTVVESTLIFVYNTLTLSVGILIIGAVMLKGVFDRVTAWLGVATGIMGIAAVVGSFFGSLLGDAAIILASLLTTFWALFTGYRLYRLALSG